MCNSSTRARGRRIAVNCLVYIVSSRSSLGYRVIFCFIKQLRSPTLRSKRAQTCVHLPSTGDQCEGWGFRLHLWVGKCEIALIVLPSAVPEWRDTGEWRARPKPCIEFLCCPRCMTQDISEPIAPSVNGEKSLQRVIIFFSFVMNTSIHSTSRRSGNRNWSI